MEITVVVDNSPPMDNKLKSVWGLALYVSMNDINFMFDTGPSSIILERNMRHLELDPKKLDFVIISHIHADHTGGLAFLGKKKRMRLYLSKNSFYRSWYKVLGFDVIIVESFMKIHDEIYVTGPLDSYIKEQSAIIKHEKGLIILTGCSHPGIEKILKFVRENFDEKIYALIGGLHLGLKTDYDLSRIVDAFEKFNVREFYPLHCTGKKAIKFFEEYIPEKIKKTYTGLKIVI